MRKLPWAIFFCTAFYLVGCGDQRPIPPGAAAQGASTLHSGILVPLSDNQGFVELLNDKRVQSKTSTDMTIVAYLLKPDQSTAASSPPPEIIVKLETAQGQKTIKLPSQPDTSDPVGSARYVSPPGPFDLNQRGGEVSVTLEGKSLTGSFRGPR